MESVIPDLQWYKNQSKLEGGPPRCPFNSSKRCPKFSQSIDVLVAHDLLEPAQNKPYSSVKDSTSDQRALIESPHMSRRGPEKNRYYYHNFCPEVLWRKYGLFVLELTDYFTEQDHEDARRRVLARGQGENHPDFSWVDYQPQHYTDCDQYSILYGERTQLPAPKYDMRGAQFGGGFSERNNGEQTGGQVNNQQPD